jgi:choline-sulfatase
VYTSAGFFWRDLRNEPQKPRDVVPETFHLRDLVSLYYGACTFTDDLVGRVFDMLATNGLDQNTVVLFTSDHGDNLGSHGRFNKNSLIEESIRIPFIMCDPRYPPAENRRQVASLIDIMPTLLESAGCPIPRSVQGRSLVPLLDGSTETLTDNVAFIETGPMIGLRTPDRLYAMGYDEATKAPREGHDWAYDLIADPLQLRNLATAAGPPPEWQELRDLLLQWNALTPWQDPGPEDPGAKYADAIFDKT